MKHLKPILHLTIWLAFALCIYCLYITEDYARFTPQTREETAVRIKGENHAE